MQGDMDADADGEADAEGDIDADGDLDESVEGIEHDHMPSQGPNGIPDVSSGVTPHLQEVNLAASADEPVAHHDVVTEQRIDSHALPSDSSSSPDMATPTGDPSAADNGVPHSDSQAFTTAAHTAAMLLQAHDSIASTVPDLDTQNVSFPPHTSAQIVSSAGGGDEPTEETHRHDETQHSESQLEEATQRDEDSDHREEPTQIEPTQIEENTYTGDHHDGETSASQYSTTLISVNQSTSLSDHPNLLSKTDGKSGKTASANRLSISYAGGTRRMVIDAKVVQKIKVFRADGRIEVLFDILPEGENSWQGIVVR